MFKIFKSLSQLIPSSLPKIPQVPKISLPQVPKISLPQIPKISMPVIPQVPKISLPQIPKISLPQIGSLGVPVTAIGLPVVGALAITSGGASALSGAAEGAGRFITGGVSALSSDVSGVVSAGASGAGAVYRGVYDSYDDAEKKMQSEDQGERLAGFGQFAGTAAFHTLAPVELGNVVAAHAEGRGNDLTLGDYAWAGFDVLFLASIPFTGGLGWAARSGIRAAVKGVGKGSVSSGGNVKVISRLFKPLSNLGGVFKPAASGAKIARPAAKIVRPGAGASSVMRGPGWIARPAASVSRPAASVSRAAASAARPGSSMASMIRPGVRTASGASSIRPAAASVRVAAAAPKKSLLRPLGMAGAVGLGAAGLTALAVTAGDPGAGSPGAVWDPEDQLWYDPNNPAYPGALTDGSGYPDDPYWHDDYYDPYGTGGSPFWDFGPGGVPPLDDPFWDPNGGGYYPPTYPGGEYFAPAEAYSQDFLDYMPFGEEINQRGIAFPVLLLGVVLIGGGGYYVYKKHYKKGSKGRKTSGGRK